MPIQSNPIENILEYRLLNILSIGLWIGLHKVLLIGFKSTNLIDFLTISRLLQNCPGTTKADDNLCKAVNRDYVLETNSYRVEAA